MDKQTFTCSYPFGRQFNETTGELTVDHPEGHIHAGSFTGALREEIISTVNGSDPDLKLADPAFLESYKRELKEAIDENKPYAALSIINHAWDHENGEHKAFRIDWFTDAAQYQKYLNLWYKSSYDLINAQERVDQSLFHWLYDPKTMLHKLEVNLINNPVKGFAYSQIPFTDSPVCTELTIDGDYEDDQIPTCLSLVFLTTDERFAGRELSIERNTIDWLDEHPQASVTECFHILPNNRGDYDNEECDEFDLVRNEDLNDAKKLIDSIIQNMPMPLGIQMLTIYFKGLEDLRTEMSICHPLIAATYYQYTESEED